MDVLNAIIQESPIGPMPKQLKRLVLGVFAAIVCTLAIMLIALLIQAPELNPSYGF